MQILDWSKFSKLGVILLSLTFVLLLHTAGLYVFVQGFLLTRVALSNQASACSGDHNCLPARYSRAVVLIVDALRHDFLFPHQNATMPYQNVLS